MPPSFASAKRGIRAVRRLSSISRETWVVAAPGLHTRYLCKAKAGHWVVTGEPSRAEAFDTEEAAAAARNTMEAHSAHPDSAPGGWAVYRMTTRFSFTAV